jgi:hypothetical protein
MNITFFRFLKMQSLFLEMLVESFNRFPALNFNLLSAICQLFARLKILLSVGAQLF